MVQALAVPASRALVWLENADVERAFCKRPPAGTLEAACFEIHPDPQFVFNDDCEIVFSNRAARDYLLRAGGPRALAEKIVEEGGDFVGRVHRAILGAIRDRLPSAPVTLALAPPLGLTLRVVPLGSGHPYALLTARPDEPPALRSPRERFGFTVMESRVSELLCRGASAARIARDLEISVETVRCHLKQAFVKAGVHRQAELVAVLLGG